MKYSNADFLRLMTEIEEQGGTHLDELCGGQEYTFTMPDGKERTHFSKGCENEAIFHVRYNPTATVRVPEPVLEPDPTRDGKTKRAKTEPDPSDPTGKTRRTVTKTSTRHRTVPSAPAFSDVRVCAIDDNVGSWPRFRHVIEDKS